MRRATQCLLLAMFGSAALGCAVSPTHTGHLLQEMADLSRLAELPDVPYKTVQFSSFDRRSNSPGGPGWFANADGFGGEEIPGFEAVLKQPDDNGVGEYLICDVEGPGVMVRTWTAGITGDLRLYLDERPTALYDGPAQDFLLNPYGVLGRGSGADEALLTVTFQQRQSAYCPIPFARRCRMVWVGDLKQVHFYHVQIRRYDSAKTIRTFEPEDLALFGAELQNCATVLRHPGREYPLTTKTLPAQLEVTLPSREQAEILKLDGPLALERLALKVEAADRDLALRQTVLHIICDDHPWGQVQAPIGDFFGAAPGINPFDSLPFTVTPDGIMTCRYVMPFATSLRVVLDNRGEQPVTVTGKAWTMDYEWGEKSMHFRARWRVDHGVVGSSRAPQDMPYLIADGTGRYVGTALMLLNPCQVTSLYGSWWGEGDEKVFIDQEPVPSTFGTGSEDYFNYAWSVPDIFEYAYCGQPRNDGPGNRGFVTNHRWHILDDLLFSSGLAFYMELYPHDRVPGMSYARIAYHYALPGTTDDHLAITDEDVRPLALPASWQPVAGFGMRNSVYHAAEDLVPATADTTQKQGSLWAGGELLAWLPDRVGDQLELRFQVAADGKYRLHLGLGICYDSGRISTRLDGESVSFAGQDGVLDLHDPHRVMARQFGTETIDLAAGQHTLTIVFDGASEEVVEPAIGVDFLAVQQR